MERRSFLVGSISAIFVMSLPVKGWTFEDDMQDVIRICHDRFENVKYLTEWMDIFEEEVTKKMKKWGTFKPYTKMRWCDPITGELTEIENSLVDPNFFGQCHTGGGFEIEGRYHDLRGFFTSFEAPDGRKIRVSYRWDERKFTFTES